MYECMCCVCMCMYMGTYVYVCDSDNISTCMSCPVSTLFTLHAETCRCDKLPEARDC